MWDRVDGNDKGHCFNVRSFFIGTGSCNIGVNLLIFILVRHDALHTLLCRLAEQ